MTKEEALNKVRNWTFTDEKDLEVLQTLIPELKESEDERIRKALLGHLKECRNQCRSEVMLGEYAKWIAYLEKQKEQKPTEQIGCTFTSYDMAKTFVEGQGYVITNPEKFGLCKPAEWSEEEERLLNIIIDILDKEEHSGHLMHNDLKACVKLLKSLRFQPHWKPSEQERGALSTAIRVLTEERNFPRAAGYLQAILDAFDGKESRKDWKPSKEQMQALEHYMTSLICTNNKEVLFGLYSDLKKLI